MSESILPSDKFLVGEHVYLCGLEEPDVIAIHAWKNDLALVEQLLARPMPVTMAEVEAWLRTNQADKNQVLLGIHLNEGNALVGVARLMFIDWLGRSCELGIWIGADGQRGKGLGGDSLRLVLKYAFSSLNLRRVHLRVAESNAAARACYRSAGFVEEGLLREHAWAGGRYENVVLMGLLQNEHQ